MDNLDKPHNKPSMRVAEHMSVSKETPSKAIKNYPLLVSDNHTSEQAIIAVLGVGAGVLVSKYTV